MKYTKSIAVLTAATLAFAACGEDTSQTTGGGGGESAAGEGLPETVRVGVPLDLTGPAAISGLGGNELAGMELALDEIEEQDFLEGTTIELVDIDTKADKQEAVAAVLRLVQQEDVDAILGFTLTPSFTAAAPQAAGTGMPVIAVGLAGSDVTSVGDSVFRILPNVSAQYAAADLEFVDAFGAETAAYLYSNDSETTVGIHETRKAALEDAGIETVIEQSAATTDTDYRAQLTEIQQAGADVVVLSTLPGQFPPVFLQAEELGMEIQFLPIDGAGRDEVLDQAGPAMQCAAYNAVWAPQNQEGRNPGFIDAVQTQLDDEPDLYYAVGYDAMWAYATALKDAESADAAAVVQALNDMEDFEGTLGVYGFDDDREPEVTGTRVQVVDSEVVEWTPDSTCER